MRTSQTVLIAVMLAVACLVALANRAIVGALDAEADFCETGYYSNLAKIHQLRESPRSEILLVGSSITARILPHFFKEGSGPVTNLGLNAGGGGTALEVLLASEARAEVIILECNALRLPPNTAGTLILEAPATASFRLAEHVGVLRPEYRPSSVVYSSLKHWNDRRSGRPLQPVDPASIPHTRWDEPYVRQLVGQARERCQALVLVNFPSIIQTDPGMRPYLSELARQHEDVSFLDLQLEMGGEGLLFTDQKHLAVPSARKVARRLGEYLEEDN